MKNFLYRLKKSFTAFVRTWELEKNPGSIVLWARSEIDHAIAEENKSAAESDDVFSAEYDVACYKSALAALECMATQNHSGLSWSVTNQILNRLGGKKPLNPLNSFDDCPEEWEEDEDSSCPDILHINRRYTRLYKRSDGTYHDIDRWCFFEENSTISFSNGFLSRKLDEMYPIVFPYMPVTIKVRVEELLTDKKHGDYDAQRIIDFIDPKTHESVKVDKCYVESGDTFVEIDKKKWDELRKLDVKRCNEKEKK